MTQLTRVLLNPARRQTRTLLASPQAMHAAVLAGFPPGSLTEPTGNGRALWRVDRNGEHQVLLYICSPVAPDLTHLVEQAGWPTTSPWESRDYESLLDRLAVGQRWSFRVTANPVHRVRDPAHPERGHVRAHVTAHQQMAWLLSRAPAAGFEVARTEQGHDCVEVKDRQVLSFRRQGATVTLARATFTGMLAVTDPVLLRRVLTSGLGRAKAYGCGLLTLA